MKKLFTKKPTVSTLVLLLVFFNAFAQLSLVSNQNIDFSNAVSTTTSGNWSNPAIWSKGVVPNDITDVIISNGHTIYIDIQGASSGQIVDLCRNLQVKPTAVLRMGHNTANFAKDLRINGSILCNGTFSAGRNLPGTTGDGSIYSYNSRIFLNLTQDQTYISGSGFFNPRAISIASNLDNKNLTIDLYNMTLDENFAIKSDKRVNVTINHFAYIKIKGILGLTGSEYQFSAPTAKSNLTILGIVVTDDVSLFTRNTTAGDSSSLTIGSQGSLYTQKINKGVLNIKTEAAGFTLTINSGGLFRLGKGTTYTNFTNLTTANPNFVFNNNGELRKHYSETLSSTATITNKLDQYDPEKGASVPQIKDVFGASHISGWYNFTTRPYLLEGLDVYKEFGATSLKTTLTAVNGNMESAYHFNDTWPNFNTLKEVAQHPHIDSLFKRTHIKKHTFWTTTKNQSFYKNGPDFNHSNYLDQEQQFYDLTKYLLQTYGTKEKTFTYQNWEGDWMLRGEGVPWETDPTTIPDDVDWEIEGMARLFRARQRGTERARNEITGATAKVFHAIEFNKLWMLKNGARITMMDNNTPSVLGNVIPSTRIDLSSWSAYDGGWYDSNNPLGHAMWKGLEIASYFTTQTGDIVTNCPVQIGEFGINENPLYYSEISNPTGITNRYTRYIGVALGLGIPNFYLWNLYGNDKAGPDGFTWQKDTQYDTAFLNQWLVGKWLKTPDGTWGVAATFLMNQWPTSTTWTGGTSTGWNTATNWSNGVPVSSSNVRIGTGGFKSSPNVNVNIKSLTIDSGATLEVNPSYSFTVKEAITNNGTLTIKNNANLIQLDNVANTGAITVNRNSNALKRLDYTLWASPVASQNLLAFSPATLATRFYTYNTGTNLYNAIADPANTNFTAGKGNLIRMPDTASAVTAAAYPGSFTGIPNNGTIAVPLTIGYNLVGNPYPSNISFSSLRSENSGLIGTTAYFWRKTNGAGGSAYCTYNTAGTPTYISNGAPGAATAGNFDGTIQSGQGFFVVATAAGNLNFTNTQRTTTTTNQAFFKTKQVAAADKLWLNATSATGDFSQMAITYSADATLGVDDYDSKYINDSAIALTSNIDGGEYTIQGRPAFDATDVVALNFKTIAATDYTIALAHSEGVFANAQDVYLLDSTTGTETNLKTDAYTFTATAGVDNARFSLKYQKTLKADHPAFNENSVRVYATNGVLYVNSTNVAINNIKVFDIQGRLVAQQNNVKANTASISNLGANQALIVQVTSEDNAVVNKKVVN